MVVQNLKVSKHVLVMPPNIPTPISLASAAEVHRGRLQRHHIRLMNHCVILGQARVSCNEDPWPC